jgi:hypothetical protein
MIVSPHSHVHVYAAEVWALSIVSREIYCRPVPNQKRYDSQLCHAARRCWVSQMAEWEWLSMEAVEADEVEIIVSMLVDNGEMSSASTVLPPSLLNPLPPLSSLRLGASEDEGLHTIGRFRPFSPSETGTGRASTQISPTALLPSRAAL